MDCIKITKNEMDERLKADKGWFCEKSGNEYVYDFHLSKIPVIIKVMSSISVDDNKVENRGSDTIRVFAVVKNTTRSKRYKIISGLTRSVKVNRTVNWSRNIEIAVIGTMQKANRVYNKYWR